VTPKAFDGLLGASDKVIDARDLKQDRDEQQRTAK